MPPIRANSVLPARRRALEFHTADGLTLVGEVALPADQDPVGTIVCVHPLPLQGGMMDSHVFRKAAWRLPALAGLAVVRFNTRGTSSAAGTSEGSFDEARGEGLDLAAVVAWVRAAGLPDPWLVGWSFGTDVVLRNGLLPGVQGAVLLSPPRRYSTQTDLQRWATDARPMVVLVPELDPFLPPALATSEFAVIPQAQLIVAPGAKHLWVGEPWVRWVHDWIVAQAAPAVPLPLPDTWDGPMTIWDDLQN